MMCCRNLKWAALKPWNSVFKPSSSNSRDLSYNSQALDRSNSCKPPHLKTTVLSRSGIIRSSASVRSGIFLNSQSFWTLISRVPSLLDAVRYSVIPGYRDTWVVGAIRLSARLESNKSRGKSALEREMQEAACGRKFHTIGAQALLTRILRRIGIPEVSLRPSQVLWLKIGRKRVPNRTNCTLWNNFSHKLLNFIKINYFLASQ